MMRDLAFIVVFFLCACGVVEDKKEKQSEIVILSEKISHDPTNTDLLFCLLYTSPSPRDRTRSRMPSSA